MGEPFASRSGMRTQFDCTAHAEEEMCNHAATHLLIPARQLRRIVGEAAEPTIGMVKEMKWQCQVSIARAALALTVRFEAGLEGDSFHMLSTYRRKQQERGELKGRMTACFLPKAFVKAKIKFLEPFSGIDHVSRLEQGKTLDTWSLREFYGNRRGTNFPTKPRFVSGETLQLEGRPSPLVSFSGAHRALDSYSVWTLGKLRLLG